MFIAEREAKCSRPRRSRAGHEVFSQRQTTSSSSRCSGLPQAAHVVGITHGTESAEALLEHRLDHARNDVAGLLEHDRVADAEILALDVLGVVQRRHRDGRSGDDHRLQHRVRRIRAGAADVDADVQQLRADSLRGELEGGRPARELGGRSPDDRAAPDRPASRPRRRSRTAARGACRPTRGRTRSPRRCRCSGWRCASTGSPQPRIASSSAEWVGGSRHARRNHLVGIRAQAPPPHQPRIQIPHRPRRGVAGIHERRLAFGFAFRVDPRERGARQVDLAADFDPCRAERCSSARRDPLDGADVRASRLRRARRRRASRRVSARRPRRRARC